MADNCPGRCDGDNPCGLGKGHTGDHACSTCPHYATRSPSGSGYRLILWDPFGWDALEDNEYNFPTYQNRE
jgi:hypothetical protein